MKAKTGKDVSSTMLQSMPDDELLQRRVRDLGLTIRGTVLEGRIERLYGELEARGIVFRPPCYLADEWLTPDGKPIVGIPFYLAHPRLAALEKKMMLEAEGITEEWCMKLLRHETGHAINYAYRLHSKTRWRELFGKFTAPYLSQYSPKPYSRRYVIHLEDNYAQAHPDEDFAETFAVWLTPGSDWQRKYEGWPALKKLRYVDHLMKRIGQEPPGVVSNETPWSAARMTSTLTAYYERKRRYLGKEFPGFYDPSLQRIFLPLRNPDRTVSAARFIRRRKRYIVNAVSMWTGQRKYDIDKLLGKLCARCEDMGLCLRKSETETVIELVSLVTVVMSQMRRFSGEHEKI